MYSLILENLIDNNKIECSKNQKTTSRRFIIFLMSLEAKLVD